MNGVDFFVDTNILIYIMEKHPHPKISSMTKCSLAVSEISEIELLGKKNITRHEVEAILNLLNDCEVIDFSKSIKDITISIKQKYTIKTPDAIIAATAKSLNLPLVTADTGFKKIEDVDIILIDLNN
ncbi:MAG: type II toxin-antitoxin system VapC family toxin [Tannerella sp.]|nr:type II toxin-antitoxin system VapC family toxin [Tannerella sp.]